MIDYNINHNLTDNIWHISNYVLFAENSDNENEIYCVNLLRCSCFILTKEEFKLLFKINDPKKSVCIPKKFIDYGLIVNYDEYSYIYSISKKYDYFNNLSISICTTMNCNFNCPYCFEKHRPGKLSSETQNDIINFIKKIIKITNVKTLKIVWFGGEPLLYPDVIESLGQRLITLSEENNIKYSSSIVTNGYLLTQEIADMLYRLKVDDYQITLDGLRDTHNKTRCLINGNPTFDKIVENLINIKINGIIRIRHNIHENNYQDIPLLENFVKELKIKSKNNLTYYFGKVTCNNNIKYTKNNIKIINNFHYGKMKILYNEIEFQNKFQFCGAQRLSFLTIDEEGRLFKCRDIVGTNELSFGHVKTWNPVNPFLTATNPNMILSYINTSGVLNDNECKNCVWLPQCGGGCPQQRVFYKKQCIPYKDIPEEYVIAICKKYLYNKNNYFDKNKKL